MFTLYSAHKCNFDMLRDGVSTAGKVAIRNKLRPKMYSAREFRNA